MTWTQIMQMNKKDIAKNLRRYDEWIELKAIKNGKLGNMMVKKVWKRNIEVGIKMCRML